MQFDTRMDPESNMLLELNDFIHRDSKMFDYHMAHIKLVKRYAILLNKKLNANLSTRKLSYAALAHDLFKERSLDPSREGLTWKGHPILQDTNRYVRTNLNVLEEYGLDEYFNTDVNYHPLSAGIFLRTEFGITDPEILYPVMFHSCPIIDIYETLSPRVKTSVDIIMLADKLSSNWLRINMRETEVRIDLDQAVFGTNGRELNYTFGLFAARLISQGTSTEVQSEKATEYYYKRLCEVNPLIPKSYSVKRLGGNAKWPKRNSQVWKTQ